MSRHIGGSAHGGALDVPDAGDELQRQFRAALAHWASGVTVVAVRDEPHVFGITVTAFASVSLEPPLVLVCLGANAVVLPILDVGTQLAISILGADQKRAAAIFTDVGPLGRELFPAEGPPVLDGALAALVCTVDALHRAGDHTIVVARVQHVELGQGSAPLLRYERGWRTLDGPITA
jgi:flavin reductase (DIM6/NTAB) family NADH-FMN oxidoreductase RutF